MAISTAFVVVAAVLLVSLSLVKCAPFGWESHPAYDFDNGYYGLGEYYEMRKPCSTFYINDSTKQELLCSLTEPCSVSLSN